MSRFFVAPEDVGAEYITIENREDLHHMNKVLRLKTGDVYKRQETGNHQS